MAKTVTHQELKSFWGQEDHLQAAQNKSFTQLIFELLSEKEPTPEQLQVFELILNLSIDHGPDTPSAVKVIEEAKKGETISEAVSEGIEQINDTHGGAIEPAMKMLYEIRNSKLEIRKLIEDTIKEDKRLAGFGHRIYKDLDPRAQLILNKLKDMNLGQEFIDIINQLELELESQKGRKLPINIDGAIAVALCSFGWDPKLGKAVFIIARTPGLCGQYLNNSH